ncbi:uncharacterized protein LOC126909763, partial [Daktulosphaira vitifoliae]|uniref:uncharacterized protein LOC126909763 n=1 Tax=Daktulosphaira vitifoliae TaxID=58002 RepID=UPI0021A9F3AC
MILIKIISLININLTLGLSFNNLQCNFSKYWLNYFNHNKQYLNEISENIELYDVHSLCKYGDAIKTHGELVLVMLDVLREADKKLYSKELMSLNLYLNNVSDDQEESSKFYENIISVGKIIIECFQNFVNMNLFGDGPTNFFFTLSKKTSTCLSHFIHKNKTDLTLSSIDFKNSLESFFYNNKIEMYVLNAYFEKNFIDDCFNKLVVNLQEVQEYLTELEKHKKLFEVTKNTFNITHILNVEHTFIFNTRIIGKFL